MKIEFKCTYCDNTWTEILYTYEKDMIRRCRICGDKKLKAKEFSDNKIDYYQKGEYEES